jgi:nucleotide-binding universal stress UspA family protein
MTTTVVVDARTAKTPVRFASVLAVVEFERGHPETLTAASRAALRHAAAVASTQDGRVTALHVLPLLPQPVVIAGGSVTDLTVEEPRVLAIVTARLRRAVDVERVPGDVQVRVVRGRPLDEIERAAEALDADLIVAGYQDRPGGYTEGFSFRALLHRATRPIVVTRATDGAGHGWEP